MFGVCSMSAQVFLGVKGCHVSKEMKRVVKQTCFNSKNVNDCSVFVLMLHHMKMKEIYKKRNNSMVGIGNLEIM